MIFQFAEEKKVPLRTGLGIIAAYLQGGLIAFLIGWIEAWDDPQTGRRNARKISRYDSSNIKMSSVHFTMVGCLT